MLGGVFVCWMLVGLIVVQDGGVLCSPPPSVKGICKLGVGVGVFFFLKKERVLLVVCRGVLVYLS